MQYFQWEHIPDDKLFKLKSMKIAREAWTSKTYETRHLYNITLGGLTLNLTHGQIWTALKIWFKHVPGIEFDDKHWTEFILPKAVNRYAKFQKLLSAKQELQEFQGILADPNHKQHVLCWLWYFMENVGRSNLVEISDLTGLSTDAVHEALQELIQGKYIRATDHGYEPIPHAACEGTENLDKNQVTTEGNIKTMRCFDVRKGCFVDVTFDADQKFQTDKIFIREWIVDKQGEVTEHGKSVSFEMTFREAQFVCGFRHLDGNPLNLCKGNLKEELARSACESNGR